MAQRAPHHRQDRLGLLTDRPTGALKQSWLEAIGDDVAALKAEGRDVILVSSGAIALGRRALGLNPGQLRLEEAQAAASVGQINLAHAYQTVFRERGLTTAQILVTLGDTERDGAISTRATPSRHFSSSGRSRSSMRMTRSRHRRSAMATTTGSLLVSPP